MPPSFFKTYPRACALVLATTTGSRLFPMTSSETPKHMLPVAGIPSIMRLLESLATFEHIVIAIAAEDEVTLKCVETVATRRLSEGKENDKEESDIRVWKFDCNKKDSTSNEKNRTSQKISIIRLGEDCFGPVHAIRQVEEAALVHPSSRLVVFPGDFVFLRNDPDILSKLIRPEQPDTSCVVLLVDVGEVDENGVPLKESAKAKKGGLAREEEDIEYIALCYPVSKNETSSSSMPRIILKKSKLDVEEDEDLTGSTAKLEIPKARVRQGRLVVRTDWSDVHAYSLAPWIRKLIIARKGLSSIQEDVLPLLVARQFKGKGATFGKILENKDASQDDEAVQSILDTIGDLEEPYSVLASVQEPKTALRANTFPSYLFACREVVTNGSSDDGLAMPPHSKWNGKFQTLVLDGATLGSKITMRSSVIGKDCQLGNKCRLNNVVVMDGALIGDNCSLQNTAIGPGAKLGENCSLNDCQVGPGKEIPAATKEKGEAFMVGDILAEEIL